MTISAKIILDSISKKGKRITTFELRYPRFIHAELMTHRVFSRNASSSRAIPVKKLIADIRNDPAMPIHWGQNQSGMQAEHELTGWRKSAAKALWVAGMRVMTTIASIADRVGGHKQLVNRLIEPWSHITVCVTSTQWSNFYALRAHPDAQPEILALARIMKEAHDASIPVTLQDGEWHLPYVDQQTINDAREYISLNPVGDVTTKLVTTGTKTFPIVYERLTELLISVSVARCARTSYKLHDGSRTTFSKDIGLYDRLLASVPLHASPAEHQAFPDDDGKMRKYHGNFEGYVQFRKLLPFECQ